jgi:hypothetical protein
MGLLRPVAGKLYLYFLVPFGDTCGYNIEMDLGKIMC